VKSLCLSGGGAKGSYFVGFVRRMVGERARNYDILCGVSVGALVASFMAQYRDYERTEMVDQLEDMFLKIENKDVWQHWFLLRRALGLWKPSFLNSRPLHELVRTRLDSKRVRASGKKLRVGAVSLTTGQYRVFNETHVPLADAVLASAAFPGFLSPIHSAHELWTDGGVQQITPLKAAIEAGATEIDVVITEPRSVSLKFEREPEALDVILRSLEIMANRIAWVDVDYALKINQLIDAGGAPGKRKVQIRVVAPTEALLSDSLSFDPAEARRLAQLGYEAACALE
jgi:predicted acylesterase/phospholipase RssA